MHAENVLEFEALRALLARYLHSPLGRAELEAVAPVSDRGAIEAALADAAEAIEYLRTASQPQPASRGAAIRVRFDSGADPMPAVARLRIEGATLEAAEILELARLLDLASETRSILLSARERFPRLYAHASAIADLRDLAVQLRGKILPDGSLADDASVALGRLRRDAEKQRRLIEESLARFLRAHHEDGTLQEDFVTIRNDRFVVPIVTGRERRVDGVIHGSSGSGQRSLSSRSKPSTSTTNWSGCAKRSCGRFTACCASSHRGCANTPAPIAATVAALGRLELLFTKAEFAIEFRCVVPRLSPPGARRLLLREARHPLLEDIFRPQRKTVVPVSLSLEGEERTLLISGPNTGGKTVALKTAGLLALMTHAGLPVPAAEAEFPLFDQVLADIGDHQSIQESLSSFSAHILAIRSMLERATADSLVLVDELGRATDPEEGGALGIVILETFRQRGVFTLASTHLMAMKVYGASTAGVRNGSMGFDEETLDPTYVLRLGAPGKSAGLDIAGRLGLDQAVIEAARSRMTSSERDVARFLAELHQRMGALEEELARVTAREQAVTARERSLEQTWERKYASKISELERRAAELSTQFEQRAQETIGELSQKARAKIAKTTREYQEAVETLAPPSAARARAAEETRRRRARALEGDPPARHRAADSRVRPDRSGCRLSEDAGGGLRCRGSAAGVGRAREGVRNLLPPRAELRGSYREINLIGQRAEQACEQVDKFLDSAALAQVERVRIVHGHGMGILKRAIADLLKENPHVAKFYPAQPEEGGTGATIVELK